MTTSQVSVQALKCLPPLPLDRKITSTSYRSMNLSDPHTDSCRSVTLSRFCALYIPFYIKCFFSFFTRGLLCSSRSASRRVYAVRLIMNNGELMSLYAAFLKLILVLQSCVSESQQDKDCSQRLLT